MRLSRLISFRSRTCYLWGYCGPDLAYMHRGWWLLHLLIWPLPTPEGDVMRGALCLRLDWPPRWFRRWLWSRPEYFRQTYRSTRGAIDSTAWTGMKPEDCDIRIHRQWL